jgi:hypothetical protein
MSHITAADILARARDIIAAGPVPPPYHDEKDGDWCPYCAIACATSQLEDERHPPLEVAGYGVALAVASRLLGDIQPPFAQAATLRALTAAIDRQPKDRT